MIIKIDDDEIRAMLVESIARKTHNAILVNSDDCWFECKAGLIGDEENVASVSDIHDMKFCFDVKPDLSRK